jgi:hypothetical protein
MLMRRRVVVVAALAIIALAVAVGASVNSEIGLNFQVNSRLAPMYNLWFHRYTSPTGSSDCQWIGQRGLIVFAGAQQDVTCFHQANPKIIAIGYLDRGVYTTDPLAQALWSVETAWLHWLNGTRAHFTWNNNPIYLPNPSSSSVRNYEATNLIPQWKTLGIDGIYLDDGFAACKFNNVWDICTKDGLQITEYDFLGWVQSWSSWALWIKSQMVKPFHIYPGTIDWYPTINSTILSAWMNGMDGAFFESSATPNTYGDQVALFYQIQSEYYATNRSAIVDLFTYSNIIPSMYWVAAYYLIAKNFTTNNLYVSPPFNYPVPSGICCEGWNAAVWDHLTLGTPQGAASIVDAFGDGTATLYIRIFQKGVVVAMQHRLATDTRKITVNLPGLYQNVTGGTAVSNITIGVNNAFIGVIPGSQQAFPQGVPTFPPILLITLGVATYLLKSRMIARKQPTFPARSSTYLFSS